MKQKKTFPEQWKVYKETIENALDRSLLQIPCRQEKVIEALPVSYTHLIGRIEPNPDRMRQVYEYGRDVALQSLEKIKTFLQ